jgi:hypothetical protein
MRSVIVRGVLVLSALGLGIGTIGCQRHEGEQSQPYEEGGGNERANLPESTRTSPNEHAPTNVETGKQGHEPNEPGRQQENPYQAGAGSRDGARGAGTEASPNR